MPIEVLCSIVGCAKVAVRRDRRNLCTTHRMRMRRHGDPLKTLRRQGGHLLRTGYRMRSISGRMVLEHVLVAERALGRRIPWGVQIHHIDGDRDNNAPSNLVICESSAYHHLLHRRARAFRASGHAHWRKCHICQQYDEPERLRILKTTAIHHLECLRQRQRRIAPAL